MNRQNRPALIRTCTVAVVCAALGFAVATSTRAANEGKGHAHDSAMKEHMKMMQGEQGAAMMKDAMLKMAAHQYLLGEMAQDAELKKMAQDPAMKKALDEVKATLKDHASLDAKKAEVAKDHNEAMMVLAHALMKQDKQLEKDLRAAEDGQPHQGH
jgi:hypothetical protein